MCTSVDIFLYTVNFNSKMYQLLNTSNQLNEHPAACHFKPVSYSS